MARDALRRLRFVAVDQGGYVTAKQAIEAGFDYPHLAYHLSAGNLERAGHGLYRFADMPRSESDDLIRLSLWSRNRADVPQAVVSHESALVLHELSELLPTRIHLTLPPSFRKRAPPGTVLHRGILPHEDIEERAGFRVTTPLRSLRDAAAGGTSQEQLDKAVAAALARGLVRRTELKAAAGADARLARLRAALDRRPKPAD